MTEQNALSTWRSRITRVGTLDPHDLIANPANWRQHPRHQHEALRELLDQVGWVQGVVVNETTGHMVDGHLRAELAVVDDAPAIPVVWVELSEDEERLVLAALDPVGDLAVADSARLEALLASLSVNGEALQGLLADLVAEHGGLELDAEMPTDADFWPFVRLQVSRETLALFDAWWPKQPGESDDEKLAALIGEPTFGPEG